MGWSRGNCLLVAALLVLASCASPRDHPAAVSTAAAGSAPTSNTSEQLGEQWIVYQSPTGLHRRSSDGVSDQPAVADMSITALHPDFSRDGDQLAFNSDASDGTRDIWTSSWNGDDRELVVDCRQPCRDADSPAWSPDGTQIAFVRIDNIDGRNPGSHLQLVDVATKKVVTILSTDGADYLGGPRWSPDGRSLVVQLVRFVDDGNDTTEITGNTIAIVDLTSPQPKLDLLRPLDSFATYPDWHPTDDLIVFAQGAGDPLDPTQPPQNLFTIRPDGSEPTPLTHQGPDDDGVWMPAFRFDNDEVLATRIGRPGGDLTLVSIRPDGSVTDLDDSGPVSGAHSRQRPPQGEGAP